VSIGGASSGGGAKSCSNAIGSMMGGTLLNGPKVTAVITLLPHTTLSSSIAEALPYTMFSSASAAHRSIG
jgi:hypothetical protein